MKKQSILLLAILIVSGCGQNNAAKSGQQTNQPGTQRAQQTAPQAGTHGQTANQAGMQHAQQTTPQPGHSGQPTNQTQRVQQTAPRPAKPQNARAKADRLAALASEVPRVQGATAIVLGNTAIVGINVDAKLDRARVGTIKYAVAEALRKDPQGARALVTADVDIVQRLREMNEDIRAGRPIAGFAEELADIAGRLVPQTPQSVPKRNQAPATTPGQQGR
ncbi:YhcN/YlaJ family sporulation lipoprotein [Aneurinibacillus sp. BA2021]|nr:YhcN/YlaJ family sporulation lipoprotein [Aneurinibacillus sp. BA2021]